MGYEPDRKIDYSVYKALKLDKSDGILTVTLSNPGKRNAVTSEMSAELQFIWEDAWQDPEVQVIIVTGEGTDFCSGADVSRLNNEFNATPQANPLNRTTRAAKKHLYGILDCEKPIIAKVRGVAYGMGVNIALACDMVFADETARFCDSHVKGGMVAGDGGVLLWPLLLGPHRAKEYLMTGEPVPAPKAEQIGLINRCLPAAELDAHVAKMAQTLRELPPHAVNYTKMAINIAIRQMTGAAFEASLAYEIYTMGMKDFGEATRAFVEKRKGKFQGF